MKIEKLEFEQTEDGHTRIAGETPEMVNAVAGRFREIRRSARIAVEILGELPKDAPLTPEEKAWLLLHEQTITEYADLRFICDVIKGRRRLNYPPDWWEFYMKSGLMQRITARF
jgi:hypothetical protein